MTSFAEYIDGSGELSYFLNGADGVQPEREEAEGVCEECNEELRGYWIGAVFVENSERLCGKCTWLVHAEDEDLRRSEQ